MSTYAATGRARYGSGPDEDLVLSRMRDRLESFWRQRIKEVTELTVRMHDMQAAVDEGAAADKDRGGQRTRRNRDSSSPMLVVASRTATPPCSVSRRGPMGSAGIAARASNKSGSTISRPRSCACRASSGHFKRDVSVREARVRTRLTGCRQV